MLQSSVGDKQAKPEVTRSNSERDVEWLKGLAGGLGRQAYGNQVALRMMGQRQVVSGGQMLGGVVQRKCACGNGVSGAGSCGECQARQGLALQTKLKIGAPGDKYEKEADRVAEQVMRMPEPNVQWQEEEGQEKGTFRSNQIGRQLASFIQRQVLFNEDNKGIDQSHNNVLQLASDPAPPHGLAVDEDEAITNRAPNGLIEDTGQAIAEMEASNITDRELEEDSVQTKSVGTAPQQIPSKGVRFVLGEGRSLDTSVINPMESFFHEDLSSVRIHNDTHADKLTRSFQASAMTSGEHIAFAAGHYRPGTMKGTRLLVHELTHVMQQRHGLNRQLLYNGIGKPGDPYELEADQNAHRFLLGLPSKLSVGTRKDKIQAVQLYSGGAAAAYARKWALKTNPLYPRFKNDCTNFVSQAVEAGGWSMLGGSCDDRKSDKTWWYGNWKCWYPKVRASYTWAGAQNFFNFTNVSGRGSTASFVRDLKIGDVLQMDFFNDGHIGHSMVVTKKTEDNLFLSYHSTNRLDEPFWGAGGILSRSPKAKFYGWKL